jgi:hypothetical protein
MTRRRKAKATSATLPQEPMATPSPRPPEPAADGFAAGDPSSPGMRSFLEMLSLVIAPSTLIIALAYWFGWTLTNARSTYFGIDSSELGYSTVDYLLRSADAAFVPIAVVLLVILAAIIFHGAVRSSLAAGRRLRVIRRGAAGCAIAGSVLTFFGVWAMFKPLPVVTNYLVPPVILGLGPVLASYSAWTLRHVKAPADKRVGDVMPAWERVGYLTAALLALLGTFWASSLYAAALGVGRAEVLAADLSSQPAVTIYSVKDLSIDAAGVTVTEIAGSTTAYRFRYSGFRLLVYSAGNYFLVNSEWSRQRGVTIVLADTPDIRIEFTPGE